MKDTDKLLAFSLLCLLIFAIGTIYLENDFNNKENKVITTKQIDLTTLNEQNIIYWIDYFELKEPDIVLAQIKLETGYLNSRVCLENGNLMGMMKNKTEYYKFSHWIESIVAYKYKIQSRYKPSKETYYQFLRRIKYAEDFNYILKLKQINNK